MIIIITRGIVYIYIYTSISWGACNYSILKLVRRSSCYCGYCHTAFHYYANSLDRLHRFFRISPARSIFVSVLLLGPASKAGYSYSGQIGIPIVRAPSSAPIITYGSECSLPEIVLDSCQWTYSKILVSGWHTGGMWLKSNYPFKHTAQI